MKHDWLYTVGTDSELSGDVVRIAVVIWYNVQRKMMDKDFGACVLTVHEMEKIADVPEWYVHSALFSLKEHGYLSVETDTDGNRYFPRLPVRLRVRREQESAIQGGGRE